MKLSEKVDQLNRIDRVSKGTYKPYRLEKNPEELEFLEEFSKYSDVDISRIVSGTVDGLTPSKFLSKEEIKLAKSTIQWLGSPVGEGFLRKCGFTKQKK